MTTDHFTLTGLFDLLVGESGLPDRHRTDRRETCLEDLGLGSFDVARLQAELAERCGVELPDRRDRELTLGGIVLAVPGRLERRSRRQPVPTRPVRAA